MAEIDTPEAPPVLEAPPAPPPSREPAPPATPAPSSDFKSLAERLEGMIPTPPTTEEVNAARIKAAEARERQAKGASDFAVAQAAEIDAAKKEGQSFAEEARQRAETIRAPQLTPPPSRALRSFLQPSDADPPEKSVGKLMQSISLFATMIGGGRAGARASLSAMTGALEGWKAGDRERADRAFADWKAQTDTMLKQWDLERESYDLWFKTAGLPAEQRVQGVQLEAMKRGNFALAEKLNTDNAVAAFKEIEDINAMAVGLTKEVAQLWAMHDNSVAQLALAKQRIDLARERVGDAAERATERKAERQERADERRQEPMHGEFWDVGLGRIRQISKQEWVDNNALVQGGKASEFTSLTAQQVQLVERLGIAPKILDRLDTLIDRITKAAPGENITQGMINRIAMKAGLAPDLQEFRSLNVDAVLELTAALSGGQPRMTILQILRGEASPDFAMTTATAQRAVDTARTTIKNRLTQTTGDPNAMEKLSARLQPYAPRPAAEGKIRVIGPNGERGKADAGQDLPPGWKFAP